MDFILSISNIIGDRFLDSNNIQTLDADVFFNLTKLDEL